MHFCPRYRGHGESYVQRVQNLYCKRGVGSQTLPKALRTQVLTALTSDFGLVGLVQYAWKAKFDLVW